MYVKTRGIILQTIKFNDSKDIVKIFTEDFGVLNYLIPISKNQKRSKKALYTNFNLVFIESSIKEKANFQFIKEITQAENLSDNYNSIFKLSIIQFLNEIVVKCLRQEAEDKLVFNFIYNHLILLNISHNPANFHLSFLSKFLLVSGHISADFTTFDDNPNGVNFKELFNSLDIFQLFLNFCNHDLADALAAKLTNQQRRELLSSIIQIYKLSFPDIKKINSLEILESVFS